MNVQNFISNGQPFTFVYLDHKLYFGESHPDIVAHLVPNVFGWQELLDAQQVWGWVDKHAFYQNAVLIPNLGWYATIASGTKSLENDKAEPLYAQEAIQAVSQELSGF